METSNSPHDKSETNGAANGSECEPVRVKSEFGEHYATLLNNGMSHRVAAKLDEIFQSGKLSFEDLDERAYEALKEVEDEEGQVQILKQYDESNLQHVTNKSAYLCGVIKTYRQKMKNLAQNPSQKTGPDEAKLKELLDRTGYSLDVTTGQRKYGGPPPGWEGTQPGNGCEAFIGKVPKDVYEDELIPLFEKCGRIWDLRLMMDPSAGQNRGYCFITFCDRESAERAVKMYEGYEIRKNRKIRVNISIANVRLFVGNIPKNKGKDEILGEFAKHVEGLAEVIIYAPADEAEKKRNRGFCFLEFDSHKNASAAKRKLSSGRIRIWNRDLDVDWADPLDEPDKEIMSKVKVLYVRNLTSDVTEDDIKTQFEAYGKVERVRKVKDYAFVHFEEREHALNAMAALNAQQMGKNRIEVSLAKPPSDKRKEAQRKREDRRRYDPPEFTPSWGSYPPPAAPMRSGHGSMRDDYYEDYGHDYRGGYAEPYYDNQYMGGYDSYSYDYPAPPPRSSGRGRGRGMAPPMGSMPRGRGGPMRGPRGNTGMPLRKPMLPRGGRTSGMAPRGKLMRGGPKGPKPLGKRKPSDGGGHHESKKGRFQNYDSAWGNEPIAQQPLGHDSAEWYHDSYSWN